MEHVTGGAAPSDALVLFGVTGDLAHKMIFPALYAMAKRGVLDVPVVGVASPPWSLAQLQQARRGRDPESGPDRRCAGPAPSALPAPVCGRRLQRPGDLHGAQAGAGRCPAPGALPRHSAVALRDGHHGARRRGPGGPRARHRRKAVRARPGVRTHAQSRRAVGVSGGCDLPHRSLPREGSDHEYPLFPLRQCVPGADLEPQLRGQRPDDPRPRISA